MMLNVFFFTIDDLQPWMKWAYYLSPMSYGQNAIVIVEFLDPRWSLVSLTNTLQTIFLLYVTFSFYLGHFYDL